MPKSVDTTTTARRKSGRVRKQLARTTYQEDSDDVGSRMPEGYNPSDDSEEEYIPPNQLRKTTNAASKSRRRGASEESDSDSNYEGRAPAKKKNIARKTSSISTHQSRKRAAAPPSQGRSTPTPVEKNSSVSTPTRQPTVVCIKEEGVQCPKEGCGKTFSLEKYKNISLKVHLANNHYYEDRIALENLRPVDDDGMGWVKDDKSRNYSCDRGCKRKMGYKSFCIHK